MTKKLAATVLLMMAMPGLAANAAEPKAWNSESELRITFSQQQPHRVESIWRAALLERRNRQGGGFVVLETEIRRASTENEKGVDGHVRVVARRYRTPGDAGEVIYAIDVPGAGLDIDRDFLIVEMLSDVPEYSYFFGHDGRFAFESVGRAVSQRAGSRAAYEIRYAAFSAWSSRIPEPLRDGAGVIGLLAYASKDRVLDEVLLVADDKELGRELAYVVDEDHRLAFVDVLTRTEHGTMFIDDEAVSSVLLRLRFRGSQFDLYVPTGINSLNLGMARLPRGLRLVPLRDAGAFAAPGTAK